MQPGFPGCRLAACLLPAMLAAWHAAADDGGDAACRRHEGPFTSTTVPCDAPLCTRGQLQGGFPATYDFTAETLAPTPLATDPNLFSYTGGSRIVTPRGVIVGSDTDYISLDPQGGPSPFVTTVRVVGGTLRYRNASGTFIATGILDPGTGQAVGTYLVELCRGRGKSP